MVRVFQTEIANHATDAVALDTEIRDEIAEQRSFGRQIEVWRGATRIGAAPDRALLSTPPGAVDQCAFARITGSSWRVCSAPGMADTRIVVAAPVEPLVRRVGLFGASIFAAAIVGMIVFATIGRGVVRATLRPLSDLKDAVARIEGAHADARVGMTWGIVEIDALSATFDALLSRIEAATQRERQFLFDASHELRTPLTRLRTQLDAAASEPTTSTESSRQIRAAQASCEALINVTESILALARDELPRGETVNVSDVVRGLAAERFAGVSSRLVIDADDEALVRVDTDLIAMAIGNLLDNALKFSEGVVTLRVRAGADAVRVEVDDAGPGIPTAERAMVLEPFYRGAAARGATRGTGLGLALTRHVAQAYGGQLVLGDADPHGLRVTLSLPPWQPEALAG